MALGGLAPIIIFTFFKKITVPSILGIASIKIPLIPIPVYLDEKLTGIQIDDYSRTISIDIMRDGVTAFEKVSGDVVNLKFRARKNNIVLTALTALFDTVLKKVETKEYQLTIFYDNIFLFDASLESFQTNLVDGTDLREISIQVANRPPAKLLTPSGILANTGSIKGLI